MSYTVELRTKDEIKEAMLIDRLFRPFETLIKPFDLNIGPLPDNGPIHLVWHFARHFRAVLVIITVLSVFSSLLGLAIIWMLAFVVDGVQASGAALFVTENLPLLLFFGFLLAVFDPLMSFIEESFMEQSVHTLLPAAMRWRSHLSVENQDVAFFEDVYAGQVASRIEQVTNSIQQQFLMAIQQIPQFLVSFVGSIGILYVMAWQLALPVVFWIAANVALAVFLVPRLIEKSSKLAEASSRATGAMTDVYSNISIVKAFTAEQSESSAIREVLQDSIDTQHQERRVFVMTYTALRVLNALLAVSIFTIGIKGIIDGYVSMGEFVAAATITRALFDSSYAFIGLGFSISRSYGTIKDAMPVMTASPVVRDSPNAAQLNLSAGKITFDNVNYAYGKPDEKIKDMTDEPSRKPVIKDLCLTINAGEKVGLIGLSGAGKSTLISLLLRLRDVNEGKITVDEQDVRDVSQTSLRAAMAVITQDSFLLNRSVRDNVRYGAPDATDVEINNALKLAEATQFVSDLKDSEGRQGLDANVGDRGVKLSGGQRQRLALARVILKDAKILLMDEATSALDSQVETEIQTNLLCLMQNKTVLVIAHRLSTIVNMDRLVVLDDGKIIEQGSHLQLLQQNGLYARLWEKQSGGFISQTS